MSFAALSRFRGGLSRWAGGLRSTRCAGDCGSARQADPMLPAPMIPIFNFFSYAIQRTSTLQRSLSGVFDKETVVVA
jgi:hypothetical protein